MNKLEEYYTENPTWEQRRFELVKDFAVVNYQHKLQNGRASISPYSHERFISMADKILSAINPTIKELIESEVM